MAGIEITIDFSQVLGNINKLDERFPSVVGNALEVIANEVLRLSQREVPLDTGHLQNTGSVQNDDGGGKIVGYHTRYAARLHEHPEYHFQNGRKGKYLEDPIKNNKEVLLADFGNRVKSGLGGII